MAQPSIAHTEEPQVSIGALARDQSHVETGPNPSTEERDVEGAGGQKDGGDLAEETERMVVDERNDEEATEGETRVERNPEGETPVLVAVGETPRNYEGKTPFVYVGGGPRLRLL